MEMQRESSADVRTILLRELPTGATVSEGSTQSGKRNSLLPTRLFAVGAVRWVERAQSTVGVCALNL